MSGEKQWNLPFWQQPTARLHERSYSGVQSGVVNWHSPVLCTHFPAEFSKCQSLTRALVWSVKCNHPVRDLWYDFKAQHIHAFKYFYKKSAKMYFSLLGISNICYSAKVEPYTCVCAFLSRLIHFLQMKLRKKLKGKKLMLHPLSAPSESSWRTSFLKLYECL